MGLQAHRSAMSLFRMASRKRDHLSEYDLRQRLTHKYPEGQAKGEVEDALYGKYLGCY